jgi:hypothetical protein
MQCTQVAHLILSQHSPAALLAESARQCHCINLHRLLLLLLLSMQQSYFTVQVGELKWGVCCCCCCRIRILHVTIMRCCCCCCCRSVSAVAGTVCFLLLVFFVF